MSSNEQQSDKYRLERAMIADVKNRRGEYADLIHTCQLAERFLDRLEADALPDSGLSTTQVQGAENVHNSGLAPAEGPTPSHVEDVYLAVRIAAEGSDWKRDSGETLAAWVDRKRAALSASGSRMEAVNLLRERLVKIANEEWDEEPSGEGLLCGKLAVTDFLHGDEVEKALLAALLPRSTSGTIPREPTKEMLAAGGDCKGMEQVCAWVSEMQLVRGRQPEWTEENPPLACAWRAMWDAATGSATRQREPTEKEWRDWIDRAPPDTTAPK